MDEVDEVEDIDEVKVDVDGLEVGDKGLGGGGRLQQTEAFCLVKLCLNTFWFFV